MLLTLDPLAAMAEADTTALTQFIDRVGTADAALEAMIRGLAKQYGIGVNEPPPDAGPRLTRPTNWPSSGRRQPANSGTIPGRAGTHRLLCGDCTQPDQVKRLLDGRKPFLMVTDPPYGVEYDAKWRTEAGLQRKAATGQVTNDQPRGLVNRLRPEPCSVAYVWHAGLFASVVNRACRPRGLSLRPDHLGQAAVCDRPRSFPLAARTVLGRGKEGSNRGLPRRSKAEHALGPDHRQLHAEGSAFLRHPDRCRNGLRLSGRLHHGVVHQERQASQGRAQHAEAGRVHGQADPPPRGSRGRRL